MQEVNTLDEVVDQDEATIESYDEYQQIADTIGMIPSLRMKDNVIQGVVVSLFAIIGTIIGYVREETGTGALAGLAGGLIVGIILTGVVLAIQGLFRFFKKEKSIPKVF
tara:strand:- start:1176 stop:1502 length:327 start_codon:yes stop_codon:yes gene_type:complete